MSSPHFLVTYDLDGTLVDSAEIVCTILNQLRSELGKSQLHREHFLPSISLGGEDLIRSTLQVGDDQVHSYLTEFRSRYQNLPTPVNSIYPHVIEALKALKALGCHLALCTNKPRPLVDKVLLETGLNQFFEYINAGGDLDTKKPHQKNLMSCMEHFNVTSERTWLVGDSTVDEALARNTGVPFIFYAPGYNDGINPNEALFTMTDHLEILNRIDQVASLSR